MDHLVALASIAALDVLAYTYVRPPRKVEHTRWCAIHAAANAIVVASALPSVVAAARHPAGCLLPGATRLPVSMGMWLHAYHTVFYELSADDRMHHSVFAALLGIPSYLWARPATNVMLFFLNGAPGGMIYAFVALRRCGAVSPAWDERRFSAAVNVVLRLPGVLFATYALLAAAGADRGGVPGWVLGMQTVLPVANAVYYAHQAVARCWR